MIRTYARLLLVSTLAFISASTVSFAQDYPSRAIEIVVPYSSGGSLDTTARIFAKHFENYIGQDVNVINITGAGGVIGHTAGATAEPDGYRLTLLSNGAVAQPLMTQGVTFTHEDFKLIGQIAFDPIMFTVRAGSRTDLPINEFVELARESAGEVSVGVGGQWNTQDLARAEFESVAGVELNRVPFDGGAPATAAMLGGHVDLVVPYFAEVGQHHETGTAKIIGVAAEERSPYAPEVPTFKESGLDFTAGVWRMIAVPADTPDEIVATLEEAMAQTMEDPAFLEELDRAGIPVLYRDSAEATTYVRDFASRTAELVEGLGLRVGGN